MLSLQIKPLTLTDQFLRTLAKFAEYDWIIFTSGNGVTVFFEALQSLSKDARVFASAKIAAIGSETAAKLSQFGINADFVPSVFTGKELANELITYTNLNGRKVLLLRSQLASKELVELLTQAGAEVQDVAVYTAVEEQSDSAPLTEKINNGRVDWLLLRLEYFLNKSRAK
jgi:uroporphyrinogen III methyltransferase/synthase